MLLYFTIWRFFVVMYHVLALLIIWIWFLYNFDNKHTFIVIVIVIVIDYFDAMRWYCLNNFVIVLSDKYINSVMRSIRWTYLNLNVYRLSCLFHNNEPSPVNEGRIKSGTFFKHNVKLLGTHIPRNWFDIDLGYNAIDGNFRRFSFHWQSPCTVPGKCLPLGCARRFWKSLRKYRESTASYIETRLRSIMTSLHSHMFRSIAHLWGKSVDHWWILFATGDGMWAPWCSICITGPFWEEHQSISPQSLINLHFTFAYPYFICVGAMHIGPI